MLQTQEHCRKVGKEGEGRRRDERSRERGRREGRRRKEEEREEGGREEGKQEEEKERKEGGKKGNRRRRKRTRVIKEGKWKGVGPNSHDVHFAVLIVPAIGRKVAWFAEGHLPLGHFDELIRTSWSVCAGGKQEREERREKRGERKEERGERSGDVAVNNCSLTQSAN